MPPILIPAYQPDPSLLQLVSRLQHLGCTQIVVVNDGSTPDRAAIFDQLPDTVTVLHHAHNQGKGAALRTGLRHLSEGQHLAVVFADADGQHAPVDIVRVAVRSQIHPDVLILGARKFTAPGVPFRSRVGNWAIRLLLLAATGRWFRDSQTGLRSVPRAIWPRLLELTSNRYEFETEMLLECRKLPKQSISIQTLYTDSNKGSHFNPVRDSLQILQTVVRWRLGNFQQTQKRL